MMKSKKVEKLDPAVGRMAAQLSAFGSKMMTKGDEQYDRGVMLTEEYAKDMDPYIQGINSIADVLYSEGANQLDRYHSLYQPMENVQGIYSMGGANLSAEERNRLYDEITSRELTNLEDAFAAETNGLDSQEYLTRKKQITSGGDYAKSMMGIQDTAEKAAVNTAHADVVGAESRNRQAITREAGRMGVDPSRVMAGYAGAIPNMAAADVDAKNRARRGVRDEVKAGIDKQVAIGRDVQATGVNQVSASAIPRNQAASMKQNVLNTRLTAPITSAMPFYSQGMQGMGNASNMYQQKFDAGVKAFEVEGSQNDAMMGAIGGAVGMAAGGFTGGALPAMMAAKKATTGATA